MIYFIQAKQSKLIKIGYTGGDGNSRLAQLQTGSPEELVFLGSRPGGIEVEREYHSRFAYFRVRGEWFRESHFLRQHINWVCSDHPTVLGRHISTVYLAGKITGTNWRDEIAPAWSTEGKVDSMFYAWEHFSIRAAVPDPADIYAHSVEISGPYWVDMMGGHGFAGDCIGDHLCGEQVFPKSYASGGHTSLRVTYTDRPRVAELVVQAIDRSDLVFAWINSTDCYGTIAEIGYAKGLGKLVVIASPDKFDFGQMWLAERLGDIRIHNTSPGKAWEQFWQSYGGREPVDLGTSEDDEAAS